MSYRLPSYNPDGIDDHCQHGNLNEPCWGQVEIVDEECTEDYSDCWVIKACEGHKDWLGEYEASDRPEDQGQTPVDDGE